MIITKKLVVGAVEGGWESVGNRGGWSRARVFMYSRNSTNSGGDAKVGWLSNTSQILVWPLSELGWPVNSLKHFKTLFG